MGAAAVLTRLSPHPLCEADHRWHVFRFELVHDCSFDQHNRPAYHAVGLFCRDSWPSPHPVCAQDHCIGGKGKAIALGMVERGGSDLHGSQTVSKEEPLKEEARLKRKAKK